MKIIKKWLPSLFIALVMSLSALFLFQKERPIKKVKRETLSFQKSNSQQKPFVILIPSFNNANYCEKNLRSVFEQKYDNYRIIYMDDCSTDGTYEQAKNFIDRQNQQERVVLIRNQTNLKQGANWYHGIHMCRDEEIIILLDGDDWFAHDHVLEYLNNCYANPDVWMTYGSFCYYPSYKKEKIKEISNEVHQTHSYRIQMRKNFTVTHLRTGYAGLFKKIKLKDLLKEGAFLPYSNDQAFMIPMIEMAKGHSHFIKEVLCLYNRENPINDDKVHLEQQRKCAEFIYSQPSYLSVSDWKNDENELLGCDLVVFSENSPMQLYALLESVKQKVTGINHLTIIYRFKDEEFKQAYYRLQEEFPTYDFVCFDQENFQQLIFKTFTKSPAHYVLFTFDHQIVSDDVDLNFCAQELKKTGAFGYFLNDFSSSKAIIPLANSLAVCFKEKEHFPCLLEMALYSKENMIHLIKNGSFPDLETLEHQWRSEIDNRNVALFFENCKVSDLFINENAQELLTKFKAGLKIDLFPYFQKENEIATTDSKPPIFIKREAL